MIIIITINHDSKHISYKRGKGKKKGYTSGSGGKAMRVIQKEANANISSLRDAKGMLIIQRDG